MTHYRCQDCLKIFHHPNELVQPDDIAEIAVRMEPGDTWPDGLCPECDAMVFFEKDEP
jgi:hypothetical protein